MSQTALERAQSDMYEAWQRHLRQQKEKEIKLIVENQKLEKLVDELKAENKLLKARKRRAKKAP